MVRKFYRENKEEKKYADQDETQKIALHEIIGEIKGLIKRKLKLPSLDVSKREIRILYTRYVDDWIILTNANKKLAQDLTNWTIVKN